MTDSVHCAVKDGIAIDS